MTGDRSEPAAATGPEQFCDGVGQIVLVRGLVRIEVLVPAARRGRAEEPPELGARLVMSAEGFLRVFEVIDRAVNESGLATPGTRDGGGEPLARMVRSPNFPNTHNS